MPSLALEEVTLAYDDLGAGPPVLLLHGFPATRQLWGQVAPALASAGLRALVPDLAGYGESQAAEGVRIDLASQARWLWRLLGSLGIDRIALVAHDVGTAAAQLMTAEAPQRVRGLALLDGVLGAEWAMEAVASIQAWDPAQAHRLQPVLSRRLAKDPAMRAILASWSGAEGGRRMIRAARDLDPRQTADLAEALRGSGVPALVVWGERDPFFPVESVARPLAALLSAPLTLVPGGHFTPTECGGEVTAALLPFLAGLPA